MMLEIPRAQLMPPPEPLRATMTDEGMQDLVDSILAVGVLFPLIVTPKNGVEDYTTEGLSPEEIIRTHLAAMCPFEIIDGHRRLLAMERAQVFAVWCNVFDNPGDAKHAMMLHANIMREDVTPAEEGWQFLELATKYEWSLDKLMRVFRVTENYINDRVELVQKDQEVAQAVHNRQINIGQAHELLREKDPARRHTRLLICIEHGYNARELKAMRMNLEAERANAQLAMPLHTPEHSIAPDPFEPQPCEWCGLAEDQDNMRKVNVHSYHLREVRAVCDQLGSKRLLAPAPPPANPH